MSRSNLNSVEYTQLYALKNERNYINITQFDENSNEYGVIVNWLERRIDELESKKRG